MSLPSKASYDITSFGITRRELAIAASGILLSLGILVTPWASIFIRMLLAVVVFAGTVLLALWRVHGVWTLEGYALNQIKFFLRNRRYIRGGASSAELGRYQRRAEETQRQSAQQVQPLNWLPSQFSPGNNRALLASVLSVASFSLLLAWVGTDGVREMQLLLEALLH